MIGVVPALIFLLLLNSSDEIDLNKTLYIYFLKFIYYLFLAVLGLCCCTWAFSSCGEWGLPFVVVRVLLIAMASLVAEHGL